MNLTIQERYNLSHLEHTFVEVYEKYKWKSTSDCNPLELFRQLEKYDCDLGAEIEKFASDAAKKYGIGTMKPNQWYTAFEAILKKKNVTKTKTKKVNYKMTGMPYYQVMFYEYMEKVKSKTTFNPLLEKRYWKMWDYLTEDVKYRSSEDTGSHNRHTKEWMERICRNWDLKDKSSYYKKLIKSVNDNLFDDEFIMYIIAHNGGLGIEIMDIKYPSSMDRNCNPQNLTVTNRIQRGDYV